MQEINTFRQFEEENLVEAWERFHELLRKCPHHRLTKWMQMHTFYNGLSASARTIIDASTGANTEILSNIVNHVAQLTKQSQKQQGSINAIQNSPWEICESCGGQHSTMECQSGQMTVE